jgi:hypothetical protein
VKPRNNGDEEVIDRLSAGRLGFVLSIVRSQAIAVKPSLRVEDLGAKKRSKEGTSRVVPHLEEAVVFDTWRVPFDGESD